MLLTDSSLHEDRRQHSGEDRDENAQPLRATFQYAQRQTLEQLNLQGDSTQMPEEQVRGARSMRSARTQLSPTEAKYERMEHVQWL